MQVLPDLVDVLNLVPRGSRQSQYPRTRAVLLEPRGKPDVGVVPDRAVSLVENHGREIRGHQTSLRVVFRRLRGGGDDQGGTPETQSFLWGLAPGQAGDGSGIEQLRERRRVLFGQGARRSEKEGSATALLERRRDYHRPDDRLP